MPTRHHRSAVAAAAALALIVSSHAAVANAQDWDPGPASWKGDLTAITAADWSYDRAERFQANFQQFESAVDDDVKAAAIRPAA